MSLSILTIILHDKPVIKNLSLNVYEPPANSLSLLILYRCCLKLLLFGCGPFAWGSALSESGQVRERKQPQLCRDSNCAAKSGLTLLFLGNFQWRLSYKLLLCNILGILFQVSVFEKSDHVVKLLTHVFGYGTFFHLPYGLFTWYSLS